MTRQPLDRPHRSALDRRVAGVGRLTPEENDMPETTEPAAPKRPETLEEWSAQHLRESVEDVAAKLRRLADEVQRAAHGIDRIGRPGQPTYAAVAQSVHHALAWGFANLHAERVVTYAADADIARTRALIAETIAAGIESTIGGYPTNEAERPKLETGLHANDATWAALIARKYAD